MDYGFLTNMIGLELRKAQKAAEKKHETVFEPELQPGHLTILTLIKQNPGQTQSAIAQAAGIDRSSLVPILKQFEKRGFIQRRKAEKDARSNVIEIMPLGLKQIKKYRQKIVDLETSITNKLGEKKSKQMLVLLKEFQKIISSQG